MPKIFIARPVEDSEKNSAEDKILFWSRVRMFLYLTKLSSPNIANLTLKQSKVNDGANPAVFNEFLCLIKYVLDIKHFGLKLRPLGKKTLGDCLL